MVDDGDFISAIAHERLSIVDPDSGEQPLFSKDGALSLAANGEIYNHLDLKAGPLKGAYFSSGSDCEVMLPLYEKFGPCGEMVRLGQTPFAPPPLGSVSLADRSQHRVSQVNHLDGIFAFVIMDEKNGTFMAARDPIGVVPLYWGWGRDGSVCFASEMKAIQEHCEQFEQFPPGHFIASGVRTWHPLVALARFVLLATPVPVRRPVG